MVTLERIANYRVATRTAPLEVIANQQKRLPREFVAPSGNALTEEFVRYAEPLIGDPLPEFVRF
jgi:6-phosphofructokinase 1